MKHEKPPHEPAATNNDLALITVQLLAPHTHENQRKKVGDTLSVNQALADWLLARGIAKIINTAIQE